MQFAHLNDMNGRALQIEVFFIRRQKRDQDSTPYYGHINYVSFYEGVVLINLISFFRLIINLSGPFRSLGSSYTLSAIRLSCFCQRLTFATFKFYTGAHRRPSNLVKLEVFWVMRYGYLLKYVHAKG